MPIPLTDREKELCDHLIQSKTNREIAGALSIAPTTVDTHLQKIYSKLGARNRVDAVLKYIVWTGACPCQFGKYPDFSG